MRTLIPRAKGRLGWFWPALLAATIVAASSRSQVATPEGIPHFDKIAHFLVFGLLGTLVVRNGFVPRGAWIAVLAVSLFGMTDEWHQSFTPGRSVEFDDWAADTLGAALAVSLYVLWPWYRALLEKSLHQKRRVEKVPDISPNSSTP